MALFKDLKIFAFLFNTHWGIIEWKCKNFLFWLKKKKKFVFCPKFWTLNKKR